jgi:hypothetical protein
VGDESVILDAVRGESIQGWVIWYYNNNQRTKKSICILLLSLVLKRMFPFLSSLLACWVDGVFAVAVAAVVVAPFSEVSHLRCCRRGLFSRQHR